MGSCAGPWLGERWMSLNGSSGLSRGTQLKDLNSSKPASKSARQRSNHLHLRVVKINLISSAWFSAYLIPRLRNGIIALFVAGEPGYDQSKSLLCFCPQFLQEPWGWILGPLHLKDFLSHVLQCFYWINHIRVFKDPFLPVLSPLTTNILPIPSSKLLSLAKLVIYKDGKV